MEPEKPPRRQTSPTTIDLTAERVASEPSTGPDATPAAGAGAPEPSTPLAASSIDADAPASTSNDKAETAAGVSGSAGTGAEAVGTKPSDMAKAASASAVKPGEKPAAGSLTGKPDADKPGEDKPSAGPSLSGKPAADRPGTDKSAWNASTGKSASAASTSSSSTTGAGAASGPAARASSSNPTQPVRSTAPSGSGTKGLAAGILGGLIVLIGAGALQYGGVLPSLSPDSREASEQVAALQDQLGQIAPRLSAVEQAQQRLGDPTAEIATLKSTVETLQSQLGSLRQSSEALTGRLEETERKVEAPASEVQLARAVAIAALKTAIDRGGPFQSELDAAKAVDPDEAALDQLKADASGGLPARRDLVQRFPAVADAMLSATRTPGGTGEGFLSRLMGSAGSLVRMRPVGEPQGNEPAAIVARIENRLSTGDLQGAQAEWQGLPDAAKQAGAGFKEELDRRLRVEETIGRLMAGATAAKQG
ncbi:hypothetical protein BJF93_20280 [Xaviernesmea oryzae]|uniref:Uncharacterized protein n=1 Tax=Xaviernesmea oryzae TaxID=464029 RepID=A0A1Q9AVX1_9HYPH|nr:hypothetical protein [Xaviernesmea oryzae]OLP59558.1 hypothetical protein BJF93_20280 [Xaviernesmea oryzae]SEM13479.1 Uncharacterized conserved protein [Xaviernesmea oryzae]